MFRFDLVWTALISLPLASAVQETAARLGLTSGRGLMSLIKGAVRAAGPVVRGRPGRGGNVFNIRGGVLAGIALIIVGLLVGPGGVSIFS